MKAASEVLDEIVKIVKPRAGCAISLRETAAEDPANPARSNWIEGADPVLRPDELSRLLSASELLHRKHPQIDWSGIPALGRWRQLVKPNGAD